MMERISGADALFLEAETSTMHMHVVGILVLDPSEVKKWSPTLIGDVIRDRIHLIAPFRWRVVTMPGGLDHPVWVEDPEFRLENHVHHHALDPPGDDVDLAAFAAEVAGTPLNRERPLWEMWIVEGLSNGSVAVVSKVHHSLMDGAAGGELMASLFDLAPEAGPIEPADNWDPAPLPDQSRIAANALGAAASRMARFPGTAVRSATGLTAAARSTISRRLDAHAPPMMAPRTLFNGPLTSSRSVALARCDLDDLRRVRTAFGTTVNDVVLAAATESLRRYLAERGALPDGPLMASVPMSLRNAGDGADLGNRTSNLMIPLPIDVPDRVTALRRIAHHTTRAKDLARPIGSELVGEWVDLTWVPTIRAAALTYSGLGLGAHHRPAFNVVISNVSGPPIPLYLGGARLVATYPMGPLIGNSGLNLTVLSQSGSLYVGVIACPELVDDVDAVATGFVDAVEDLAQLATTTKGG